MLNKVIEWPTRKCSLESNTKIVQLLAERRYITMRIAFIQKIVNKWPGRKLLGVYSFLPVFFVLGAALEFSMINWRVGEVNFYNTFKKRQAHDIIDEKIKKYSAS